MKQPKRKPRGIAGVHTPRANKDEWLTPPHIVDSLGVFDLDPCACKRQPGWVAGREFYKSDDGLTKPWVGRVFCNPPYGKQTGAWLAKCAKHKDAIALIFARTETKDWFEHVWGSYKAHSVLFLQGRLHFHHANGKRAKTNAGAPSALVSYDATNTWALRTSGLPGKLIIL